MASIILIDDYDHFRMIINMMLENSGHKVRLAVNGQEGLDLFRDAPADIVLTDLHMPGMSGIDIIPKLRSLSDEVKIIVMSGFLDQSRNTKKMGADKFITKPVSSKKLLDAINELLPQK